MYGANMKVYDEVCFQNNLENVNNIKKNITIFKYLGKAENNVRI